MASGLIGNEVPLTGLRVRVPCPPLLRPTLPRRSFLCFFRPFPVDFLLSFFIPVSIPVTVYADGCADFAPFFDFFTSAFFSSYVARVSC